MPKSDASTIKPVDQRTEAEIDQLHAETLEQLAVLQARWRGLARLTEKERANHPGKNLFTLIPALTPLFTAMLPSKHDDKDTAAKRAAFARIFDAFGDKDGGEDPDQFEPELLLRRIHRVKAQQEVADKLTEFGRLLSDDVLHTSETVLIPGQHALDMARTLANSSHAVFLTEVFDALRAMTKAARARLAQIRAAAAAAPPAAEDATKKP